MRRSENHLKHERIATFAFIITLVIALAAFYYVWQQNVTIGKTVAGVRSFACVQYLNQHKDAETCPELVAYVTATAPCCCWNPASTSRFKGKVQLYVPLPVGTDQTAECTSACASASRVLKNVGRCSWIEE